MENVQELWRLPQHYHLVQTDYDLKAVCEYLPEEFRADITGALVEVLEGNLSAA